MGLKWREVCLVRRCMLLLFGTADDLRKLGLRRSSTTIDARDMLHFSHGALLAAAACCFFVLARPRWPSTGYHPRTAQ